MAAPTPFHVLVSLCQDLQREPRRLRKMALIGDFLAEVTSPERAWAARFLIGQPLPEGELRQLNLGGVRLARLAKGDGSQRSLGERRPVTLYELGERLQALSRIQGVGSVRRRERLVEGLYRRMTRLEQEWFLRMLGQEMRHGVQEGVVLEACARKVGCPVEEVRRAHMLRGDTGEVVSLLFSRGCQGLRDLPLRVFRPMRVMLAETAYEPSQALAEHGGRTAFEYKFDGARVIIHKQGEQVRVFTRRLNEVTFSVPEVVEQARKLRAQECVLEGEAVGVHDGKQLPFQTLMRRFRRVHDLGRIRKEIAIRLYLFDVLHVDGTTLLSRPYHERWQRLEAICPSELLAPRIVTDSARDAQRFFNQAVRDGHEGVIAKRLDSPYLPGTRGSHWLKIKQVKTLDVVILGAEWGTGRRRGWLSNYHLAVRVPPQDQALLSAPRRPLRAPTSSAPGYVMVGKTFKGPTDKEFEALTRRLEQATVRRESWGVRVEPRFVVEVEYEGVQSSPYYASGYSLRFARIVRLREDKSVQDVDTLGTLHRLAGLQRGALVPASAQVPVAQEGASA